ncbi:P1 family peptidase [Aurantimonas sp. VKM B-3413]|uniref:P1 family peptidase n=1 Tax=Aurantimonas sp. VKM B-3413 TaxID=2779401 RepID=UPI001E34169F|nr:P1 family peptidase [Aurantimonas sp. VKM B-3413]MCB8839732.1 P1 family peptidase [Aurantimonas sp. VKM B-3413]
MADWRPGPRNLLTDVAGLAVGHASDEALKSGSTVVVFDRPVVAGVEILGGAPGTRETDLLAPSALVSGIDALVLSGGSAFGLDAASGVQSFLRQSDRGFEVAGFKVPLVPAAILFDLANQGDKDWGLHPPYRDFGYAAAATASLDFDLGSVGAGTGCTTGTMKGGLGSASTVLASGVTVAALVAVNAVGSVSIGDTRHFWAAPFEIGDEFGGLGMPSPFRRDASRLRTKFDARLGANTTIGIIATDAIMDKGAARRLAIAAHDGLARSIWPSHTDFDGDLVFAAATGASGISLEQSGGRSVELGAAAAATMARAVARGIYAATAAVNDLLPTWSALEHRTA